MITSTGHNLFFELVLCCIGKLNADAHLVICRLCWIGLRCWLRYHRYNLGFNVLCGWLCEGVSGRWQLPVLKTLVARLVILSWNLVRISSKGNAWLLLTKIFRSLNIDHLFPLGSEGSLVDKIWAIVSRWKCKRILLFCFKNWQISADLCKEWLILGRLGKHFRIQTLEIGQVTRHLVQIIS